MKKILVTGGLGFIGGRLVNHLLENTNAQIIVSSRRVEDLTNLFASDMVELISNAKLMDIKSDLPERIDSIIHLASTNEIQSREDTYEAIQVNIVNSYRLLEKAIKQKVRRFVYLSTAHVYCSPLEGEITENSYTIPMQPYSITHKAFEDFLRAAHVKNQIEVVIIRLSNAFGKPAFPNLCGWALLVCDLTKQAVQSNQMKLNTSGTQLRDFVTLTDVCRAILHLLLVPNYELGDGIFNVGGNFSVSVFDMARIIQGRFIDKFNLPIQLLRPELDINQQMKPSLKYCSNRLALTGFEWKNNVNCEVDGLIITCLNLYS